MLEQFQAIKAGLETKMRHHGLHPRTIRGVNTGFAYAGGRHARWPDLRLDRH